VRALLDASRLGDTRAADAIERLGVDCVVARHALAYARAVTRGDAAALDAAALAFAEIGMSGVAADAAAQAAAARDCRR
jgi:hypothetical protein